MVKRREPASLKKQPTNAQIEAFASGADGGDRLQVDKGKLNPNAKREYKAIRVPFNEYEYSKLEELAAKTGRSKLNALRWAVLKLVEESDS
jgi:hypothetical protein